MTGLIGDDAILRQLVFAVNGVEFAEASQVPSRSYMAVVPHARRHCAGVVVHLNEE